MLCKFLIIAALKHIAHFFSGKYKTSWDEANQGHKHCWLTDN